MSTKDEVLKLLTAEPKGLSGEWLARKLGISRAAVWKAVHTLTAQGCCIEAVRNRGYRLVKGVDELNAEVITAACGLPAEIFEILPSTNIIARERASHGAPQGTIVAANTQTSGRGRRGRSFVSGGLGVYMSVILRPEVSGADAALVTTAAAVAVREAVLEVCGKDCGIKWVNDLYLGDKKVCGILTEAVTEVESGEIRSMVVGIGVNFRGVATDFPPELRNKAGFLMEPGEGEVERNGLIVAIASKLVERSARLASRDFMDEYRRHNIVLGRRVEYIRGNRTYVATALDVDDNGGLEVLRDDGVHETITAGEVEFKLGGRS